MGHDLTIRYPEGNATWTEEVMVNYGANSIIWESYKPENPFRDVPAKSFYEEPLAWAVAQGITNGISATEFGPLVNCNRAQVATFLWRAACSAEPGTNENPFTDVKGSDFFYKAVLWAVEQGITNGISANQFGPGTLCNRAQVVSFLYRSFAE